MTHQEEQIHWFYYIKLAIRKKWLWILPCIFCPLLSLTFSFFLPKIYETRSIILIQDQNMVDPLLKNLIVSPILTDRVAAIREQILAWPRLLLLIERIKLNSESLSSSNAFQEFYQKISAKIKSKLGINPAPPSPEREEEIISELKKKIDIKMNGKDIITISYEGKDPKKAQQLVNTLSDILIEKNLSLQKEDTGSAIDFIKEQLDIYKTKLEESEEKLRKFKEIYGDSLIASISKSTAAESSQSPQEKEENKQDNNIEGETLVQINQRIAELEARLIFSSVEYTEEYPRVVELKKTISLLKEKRNQYIEKIANKIGVQADSYLTIADSIPKQQETMSRLIRENDISVKIYGMLLERYESAKITERLDESSNRTKFRIIEPARFPLIPIKPNKFQFFFAGIFLGVGIGFVLVYLADITDITIKHEEQLEATFKLPVLGSISTFVE
jgi:polysaccharide biosynthesis transport protein